eukprot:CAMPEP_0197827460 /NCGR_PEP_ID=MMETSP1437-20131217/4221_1 /TAXON_ID=49252 ORGANISM="Eucampia antarctica, Strain CCMP1452" /NCGR_SAMPLE_ID=MMETSP1437 /ASSEMBLY_ACC=CAM_ASM_001096 /LENGTH=162 /DNA_ID=CAMNT_0043428293 /DNA_START=204 /DNA_END=692 /DNA_ORIENTATION=+
MAIQPSYSAFVPNCFGRNIVKNNAINRTRNKGTVLRFYDLKKLLSTYNRAKKKNSKESKSESPYFQELRDAARDPKKFEEFVLKKSAKDNSEKNPTNEPKNSDEVKKQENKVYKRVEEWDEDLKNRKDGNGMTWEEKVQFDGLRFGNQVKQNDILQKDLNRF